ncbi:hypothetical protein ADL09_26290 [Streptomyces sp. NRRL F-7442]|nr:hypothetical protein ADL09_26290 [Streptomyces sp. NRRL F-7442]
MTQRVGSAKTIASTEGMSTPSAIRREFARIAQSAAANAVKVSARWAGVCSPWAKNSCGGDVRDEGGIGAGQQAHVCGSSRAKRRASETRSK